MSKTINYDFFVYCNGICNLCESVVYRLGFTLLQERYYELLESVTAEKESKILWNIRPW